MVVPHQSLVYFVVVASHLLLSVVFTFMVKNFKELQKRILLKLSGEVLAGNKKMGFEDESLRIYTEEIGQLHSEGTQVIVIIGGGNLWRGNQAHSLSLGLVAADYMGMLATMINAVALRERLKRSGIPVRLMSRLNLDRICERYSVAKALHHLGKGKVLIIGGGTGNPCFTTDSAAALAGVELEATLLVKGTKVNGIYGSDPHKDANAIFHPELTIKEALDRNLAVLDKTALLLCLENRLPIAIYNASKPGNLQRFLREKEGGSYLLP